MFVPRKRKEKILGNNKTPCYPQAFCVMKKVVERTHPLEIMPWYHHISDKASSRILFLPNSQLQVGHWKHSFNLTVCVDGNLAQENLNLSLLHVQFLSFNSSQKKLFSFPFYNSNRCLLTVKNQWKWAFRMKGNSTRSVLMCNCLRGKPGMCLETMFKRSYF